MSSYRRATEGNIYFFTVVTHRRQRFLIDADVRSALRMAIERVRQTAPFQMDAFVLLPDHLHCVWTLPENDRDYSTRWRLLKTFVTQACRERLQSNELLSVRRAVKGQSTLWQNRYWEHLIRDEDDFMRHIDYIHWNPVKHGLVKRVADWPYSSFHRYVKSGMCAPDWAGSVDEDGFGE